MIDLIDRQLVLKAIDEYERLSAVSQTVRNMTSLREIVEHLPSAQPDSKETSSTHKALDTISRQAAVSVIAKWMLEYGGEGEECERNALKQAAKEIKDLPSAQPDIIRCNACKHWTQTTGNMRGFGLGDCDYINAKLVNCNGFCYWAERRTDG